MTDQLSETDQTQFEVDGDRHDELFDALSNSRRRFTLQHLQTAETPLPVGELATELQSWESNQTVSAGGGADQDTIEISLLHSHLPKMAEAGLVSYDATRQMVALGDRTEEVQSHLQAMTATETT